MNPWMHVADYLTVADHVRVRRAGREGRNLSAYSRGVVEEGGVQGAGTGKEGRKHGGRQRVAKDTQRGTQGVRSRAGQGTAQQGGAQGGDARQKSPYVCCAHNC